MKNEGVFDELMLKWTFWDYDKIAEDAKWDGLKGYVSNTNLHGKTVYEEYSGLWQVERAFRITQGTLELRPMFHFTKKRIEAHVCMCFVAYKVYKELERRLKNSDINKSVDTVLDIAKTTIKIKLPVSGETITKTMLMTAKYKSIANFSTKISGKILGCPSVRIYLNFHNVFHCLLIL